ncbi:MAG: U32 family peptidase [Bacilli bacterium]|nr:U32 family peptidase [Bacilli bacterium]
MKRLELLAPAGDLEKLKMAVLNGADAVYMAGKKFGARAFSKNFEKEEIIEAINFCHLYGVKLYVTINTIVYDKEVQEFIDYVDFLHKNNVDAVIVQDLGMADLIHKTFPNLNMHASTQMNVHNINALKHLKKLGFRRVVLAREVSLSEIKQMKKEVDIELEVFVHGALCISCSGQCYYSYFETSRSGNRGVCAQLCRQPYSLYKKGDKINLKDKYLLSPKDLCTVENLNELIDVGIDSFKIEGRMKSSEYVALVTRVYRNKIDYNKISENDIKNIKKVFNREFTLGNLYNKKGKEFINGYKPNHMGILLGKVIGLNNGKVKIKLYEDVHQEDAIRFILDDEIGFYLNKIYKNDLLVNGALKGDVIEVECKKKIPNNTLVFKTIDKKLNEYIISSSNNLRKVLLDGEFIVNNGVIIFTFTDKIISEKIVLNDSVYKAKNKPTTELEIKEKLNKLGNSIYLFNHLKVNIPNDIFIPMTIINNLKRQMIDILTNKRININNNYYKEEYKFNNIKINITNDICFEINNEENLKYLLENTNYICYVKNYLMYNKYKSNNRIIYKMPRINKSNSSKENCLISEIGEITNNTISDTYFNVVNSYNVRYLHEQGVKKVTLSYELDHTLLKELVNSYRKRYNESPNLEVVIYGKPELMISRYCILNTYLKIDKCNLCNSNDYYLVDKYNKKFPIRSENCYMKILNYNNINIIDKIDELRSIGVTNFKLILDTESIQEVKDLINYLKNYENVL